MAPLTMGVDIAWGADLTADPSTWTWTTVQDGRVLWRQQAPTIRRGRPDEAGQHQPSSVGVTLRNDSGDYTPDFATGTHYPNVVLDTPLRIWAEVAECWLAGDASTVDHASLDITGDIFVALDFDSNPVEFETLARKENGAGQRSWIFYRFADSGFSFRWSANGTDWLEFVKELPYRRGCIGVHLDVNNGASGRTVTWFWKNDWSDTWEEVGTETTSGTTSIFSSTAAVTVGTGTTTLCPRRIRRFELRSGDETGTVVADPDWTAQTVGDTSFADDAGRTWTQSASELTNREVRFFGNIAEFEPYWPVGKIAATTPLAFCSITAAGVLRRLRQGASVLGPALNRSIPTYDPIAYWPMDDGSDSTHAFSPLPGVAPCRYVGALSPGSSDDTVAGSNPLIVFPGPMASTGVVGDIPPSTIGTFSAAVLYYATGAPGSESRFFDIHTSTGYLWRITYGPANATVYLYNESTVIDSQAFAVGPDVTTGWQWMTFTADQDGSDIDWSISWHNVDGSTGSGSDTFTGVSLGCPRSFTFSGADGWAGGHVCFFDTTIDAANFPALAWAGERSGERIVRLASESSIDADVFWGRDLGSTMGPQPIASRPDAMEDCATAEAGIFSERIDGPGLVFQNRDVRYNRPIVEFSARMLANPFRPTSDDQQYRNDITVERPGGSSARAVDPDATATYEDSVSVNVETDDALPDAASWLLHIGTWPGMRYPTITFDLSKHLGSAAAGSVAFIRKVASLIPGDVVRITDLPAQHPAGDVDLIIEGWSEVLTPFEWRLVATCSPAGPWTVGILEDDVLGRADTAGSRLAAALNSSATSFDVETTLGPVWIDDGAYPTEFPYDIIVGGEIMTVTACTDTASPQTFTVTRSVNGVVKSHADEAAVSLAHPLYLAR